ncbi:hypothetical protein SSX86_015451 [Deinandra increscens subsp. villosa]|uniref:Uncharacterized protein n=1 Tax=Deinandra increscens subsp. villosa TaxID=3103831 RepID=A0AAP0D036_9ASTR
MLSNSSRSSFNQLEIELIDAGNKLLHLPSSTADIHNALAKMKRILSKVEQDPSESTKSALQPITKALIAKELVRHPDIDVNISVACCFCEILRISAPNHPYDVEKLKDFFEMVVITFEKLSSASGGCYKKMAKVLKLFSNYRLPVLMWDLDLDAHGLIVRLFMQFLTAADSNSSQTVFKMEEIMTMIIDESEELKLELVSLLVKFLKNNDRIASPVSWQLGEKVLMNFGARYKPNFPDMGRDMSIALYDYSRLVASICNSASKNDIMKDKGTTPYTTEVDTVRNAKTRKMKIECLETADHCQHEEKTDSCYDPPKCATEVNGKRKRNGSPLAKQIFSLNGLNNSSVKELTQDRDPTVLSHSNTQTQLRRSNRRKVLPWKLKDYIPLCHITMKIF